MTLHAHNDLFLNADIQVGGNLHLLANRDIVSSTPISLETGGGDVLLSSDADGNSIGQIRFNNGFSITSNAGNITLGGGDSFGSGFAHGHAPLMTEGIRIDAPTTILSSKENAPAIGIRGFTSFTDHERAIVFTEASSKSIIASLGNNGAIDIHANGTSGQSQLMINSAAEILALSGPFRFRHQACVSMAHQTR